MRRGGQEEMTVQEGCEEGREVQWDGVGPSPPLGSGSLKRRHRDKGPHSAGLPPDAHLSPVLLQATALSGPARGPTTGKRDRNLIACH